MDVGRKISVEANVKCVALVVVEGGVAGGDVARVGREGGCADTDEATGDAADLLGELIGVGKVRLAEAPEMWAAEGELPGLNERTLNRDGNEDAGFADVVVVEEVAATVFKGVGVEKPAVERDLDPKLMLFVALTFEGDVAGAVGLGVGEGVGGDAGERWRLVEVSVEAAEDPVQARDLDSGTEAGVGGIFGYGADEMSLAEATGEGEPGCRFEVVLCIELFDPGGGDGVGGEVGVGAVVEDDVEEVVFILDVAVKACGDGVAADDGGDGGLQASVEGGLFGVGGGWQVVGVGLQVGLVVVDEGSELGDGFWAEGAEPACDEVAVGLVLAIAQGAGIVELVLPFIGVGVDGDLVEIGAELADNLELVGGVKVVDRGKEAAKAVRRIVDGLGDGGR